MIIRNTELNKIVTIPFTLTSNEDKEDLINRWVESEGVKSVNQILDFEVDKYQYEGDTLTFQFKFFCCGDDSSDGSTNPFFPFSKQNLYTTETGYFINSYANTLRDVVNLTPVENQIVGVNIVGTTNYTISERVGSPFIKEVTMGKISDAVISNSQFLFTYFSSDNPINRKQIDRIFVNGKSTLSGYDPFYYNRLVFTADTASSPEFNLNTYDVIGFDSVVRLYPFFTNFYDIPKGVTFDYGKIPTLSLDRFNKTLGNNIYLPKNNDLNEMFLQILFYNPKNGKTVEMISKSGTSVDNIIDPNRDGTIFLREQYTDKYSYIKINLSSNTKTYNVRLYNPFTDDYDINPTISGGTIIPLYEKIISDIRVTNQPSIVLPNPNTL